MRNKKARPWRIHANKVLNKPSGGIIIKSRLRWWYVLIWIIYLFVSFLVLLPLATGKVYAAVALLVGLLAYSSAYSSIEIKNKQLTLRRYGWLWPAIQVPLAEVVCMEGHYSSREVTKKLVLEYDYPFSSDKQELFIFYQGKELDHFFDAEFAWFQLKQVAPQCTASTL